MYGLISKKSECLLVRNAKHKRTRKLYSPKEDRIRTQSISMFRHKVSKGSSRYDI